MFRNHESVIDACRYPFVLLQAGLVEREQRGSLAYFRVKPEPLAAPRGVLA